MIRIVVLEPDRTLRDMVRVHLASEGDGLHVAATLDEAMRVYGTADLVIVRTFPDADVGAAYPCAFELEGADHPLRLVALASPRVPTGREAIQYLHELDRILAVRALPAAPARPLDGLAADFPVDAFEPLAQWGALPGALLVRVRERITGRNGVMVQIDDAHPEAPDITRRLYRTFAERAPSGTLLRHEYSDLHSFVHMDSLPLELLGMTAEPAAAGVRAH